MKKLQTIVEKMTPIVLVLKKLLWNQNDDQDQEDKICIIPTILLNKDQMANQGNNLIVKDTNIKSICTSDPNKTTQPMQNILQFENIGAINM